MEGTSVDPVELDTKSCVWPEQNQNMGSDPEQEKKVLIQDKTEQDDDEEEEEEEEGGNCRMESKPNDSEQSDTDWIEERFRIDRKKLETMLYGTARFFPQKERVLSARRSLLTVGFGEVLVLACCDSLVPAAL
ncbi:bicaudal C homolog 2 isoform X2 [Tachysurus ichikawai]